ncbi:MAG: sigma 54-interacting transcriptional regulator, partial [Planctomycetes bacterium]|nr:sigma 54-interacting transcriptional regulator [Planctomycetota bacterium]
AAAALLSALDAAGFIAPTSEGGQVALVHSVVGQTALGMLAPADRSKLHDAVAAAIPRGDPGAAVRRAYHVSRGTAPDAALAAATDAARKLRDIGEPGRAAGFVRQALRVLPERDPRVPRVRRSLADLLVRSGRPEAAANVYRDLLADEREPMSRAVLLLGLADSLDGCGLPAETRNVCREGLDLIARLPASDHDVAFTRLSLLARLAGAQRATGELREAIETVRAALALAGSERVEERASLLSLLGNVYVQLGDLVRARQFHESCLAACRDLGRRRGMATALHNLAVVHARLGERDEAQRTYRQALRLSRRANDLPAVAQTLGNLANLRAEAGDFAVAERLQSRSLAIRRRIGDSAGTADALGNMAGVLRARGRMGRALAMLQTAVKRLQSAGDVEGEAQFLLHAASIHLWADDLLGARPLLVRSLTLARNASLRGPQAGAELLLGRLERRAAPQSDEWMTHLEHARGLYELAGDRTGAAEALLETALGERDRGRRGSAIHRWRAATALLAGSGATDAEARAGLVRGRIESDRAPDADVVAGLEKFLQHARVSGRRDYVLSGCVALGRARLLAGAPAAARPLVAEAEQIEDDLEASLPPGLRRCREQSPVRGLLARLRADIDNAAPPAARPGDGAQSAAAVPGSVGDAAGSGLGTDPGLLIPSGDDMDQDRLLKLLEINKQLNQAQDMRALLDTIMDVATESTGGERGFLIVVEDQKISFQAARNFQREEVAKPELKISSSVVKRVMRSGQPILTDNAKEDERFAEFKSVERLELKSILAVPFRVGTEVMGALYLDNPARKGAFGPGDLQFLSALGDQAALAIRNLRQAESMAALNRRLEQNLANKSAQLEVATKALSERATKYPYDEIVGSSSELREVLLLLDKVADTDVPVLVQGESGTGKELIARAIHRYGRRHDGPFVGVNCGAITASLMESELFGHVKGAFTGAYTDKKGLFEAANGGTIFLDENGEMDVEMQKKLLRVLQEREVRPVGGKASMKIDVRVIAATNKDLRKMMQEGRFREDLYYRVAVISLTLPSLRERAEDIPALVGHCVARAGKELGLPAKPIDDDAMDALQAWSWPGNVRELDNEVKKSLTLSGDRVTLQDLSPQIQEALRAPDSHGPEPALVAVEGGSLKESLEKAERTLIERALERTAGNQTRAARDLGISRVWLRKKMEKYGLLPHRSGE